MISQSRCGEEEEGSGGTGRSGDPLTAEKRRWHRDPTPQPQPDLKIEPSTSSDLVPATISWRDCPASFVRGVSAGSLRRIPQPAALRLRSTAVISRSCSYIRRILASLTHCLPKLCI